MWKMKKTPFSKMIAINNALLPRRQFLYRRPFSWKIALSACLFLRRDATVNKTADVLLFSKIEYLIGGIGH